MKYRLEMFVLPVSDVDRAKAFYVGGGPAITIFDHDNGSDTEGGLNLLAGLEFGKVFVEVKGGLFDAPDLKVGIGYTFR